MYINICCDSREKFFFVDSASDLYLLLSFTILHLFEFPYLIVLVFLTCYQCILVQKMNFCYSILVAVNTSYDSPVQPIQNGY